MHARQHRPGRVRRLVLLAAAGVTLVACGDSHDDDGEKTPPASLEEVGEDQIPHITLTAKAAERLDIQTSTVDVGTDGAALQVPYAAVIYQADGSTWVYTNGEALVYLREPIEIDRVVGDVALLTSGPAPGTAVVTVGASELWGYEFGVGK